MVVVYDSQTGNCKKFALEVDKGAKSINEYDGGEVLLVTHTTGLGKIPTPTKEFLKLYGTKVIGLVSSGEARFKLWYHGAGKTILKKYKNIKLVAKIEKSGTQDDVNITREFLVNSITNK